MSPRLRVVVSGGIGSGKSTVTGVLSELGWSVINADVVGREVLTEPAVVALVATRWPAAVVGGEVSRGALAEAVFADRVELRALEEITQPLIVDRIEEWLEASPKPTAVEVSVLKVVSPQWGTLAIVHAPRGLRKQRALQRGMTPADVEARMAVQPSDSELLAAAGVVIDNQGTVDELTEAVRRFDESAKRR